VIDEALADWLQLREDADWAARSAELTRVVARRLPPTGPLRVLDLATGTGSNLRYLADRLRGEQQWLLVDRSPDLLSLVVERTADWAAAKGFRLRAAADGFHLLGPALDCTVVTRQMNLDLPFEPSLFHGRHLVTGSAILDLVSERWLHALAAGCRDAGATALFALTYDGQSSFSPPDPDDDLVREGLNAHQLRDKGLGGPATGPAASRHAEQGFGGVGYDVAGAASTWVLPPEARPFQQQLIEGLAAAAAEQAPHLAERVAAWRRRRLAHVDAGHSHALVGHHDLAAWPRHLTR
jgi:SAM-dependent methyltransferase